MKLEIAHLYINQGRTVLLWHKLQNIKKKIIYKCYLKKIGRGAPQPTLIRIIHIHNLKKHVPLKNCLSPHTTQYTIHTTHNTLHTTHF